MSNNRNKKTKLQYRYISVLFMIFQILCLSLILMPTVNEAYPNIDFNEHLGTQTSPKVSSFNLSGVVIDFYVEGPNKHGEDIVNIKNVTMSDEDGGIIEESDMEVVKYHIYKNIDNNEILSGNLSWNVDENSWDEEEISLTGTGFGTFYVTVEFRNETWEDSRETLISEEPKYTYERTEELDIDFYVVGPSELERDQVNIEDVEVYRNKTRVTDNEMKVAKFHIYRNMEGDKILSGDLEWDGDKQVWKKEGIDPAWTGNGKFHVTVEFQTEDMQESIETAISDEPRETYERENILEIIIQASIIIGIILLVGALIIGFYLKKQNTSLKRKSKKSEKPVKIKKINKKKIKDVKKTKEKKEKEKGKTEETEDLIFSVPKWEDEEED
ncbi:MAG: hypothetical protein R6U96_11615 [Promethearchaeia archaeon]